ncbi:MAG: hypothetical protein R2725_12175 [Solirubrobacterales bacterium]
MGPLPIRSDLLGVGQHYLGDVGLDDPRDRRRVAAHLHRDLVVFAEALGEQLQLLLAA